MSDENNNIELEERIQKLEERLDNLKLKPQVQQIIYEGRKNLESLKKDIESLLDTVSDRIQEAEEQIEKSLPNFESQIDEKITEYKNIIDKTYSEQEETIKEIDSLKSQIQEVFKDVEDSQADINKFYNLCFDGENSMQKGFKLLFDSFKEQMANADSQIKEHLKSNKNKISEKITEWNDIIENQKQENQNKYNEITDLIAGLLPSAGTTGLSYAYRISKEEYGLSPLKFDTKTEKYNTSGWKTTGQIIKNLLFYTLFIGPTVALIYFYWKNSAEPIPIENRLFISIPAITLLVFGIYSIISQRKMYEAYNHKQRVMEVYNAFSKKLENNKELSNELINIVLKTIKEKPQKHIKNPLIFLKLKNLLKKNNQVLQKIENTSIKDK